MTPHIEAAKNDIAKTVIMAGDPFRVKYIAENFLEDSRLVSKVREMYCYTGYYHGRELTVKAHGMGIPSMGIYSYELFHFYDVDNIIRIGTCGSFSKNIDLFDIILTETSYTESNYAYSFDGKRCNIEYANPHLNKLIEETAEENDIKYVKGTVLCNECFDPYLPDKDAIIKRAPKDINIIASEMEAFSLFYNAKREGKKAACILTVVDIPKKEKSVSVKEREISLNNMIKLALNTAIKL